ncbi:MAG: 2' O-ribose methyltransferase [Claussenomyces sp. TS43310]|nr:MAG: 2' O-ribose methyltransferase [Claussenomyces sp. TS43310]
MRANSAAQIDAKYRLFKKGQTVVDLGYAPGSWSQVAVERTKPTGRILGIDIIPAQPPKGASSIQGNFLSKDVQAEVKRFLADPDRGRPRQQLYSSEDRDAAVDEIQEQQSYIDMERHRNSEMADPEANPVKRGSTRKDADQIKRGKEDIGKMVDIVLSDMCEPWPQTEGFWKKTLSDPYLRMMNTSGINFRDHAGSMDLCAAALQFAYDTLRVGGHFICKFYQGAEDKQLEKQLKKLFAVVHREKPESSRSESKEAYFVALRRKAGVKVDDVFGDDGGSFMG